MQSKLKKILYGNYIVQSPSKIIMFRCDEKKANWYLKRGLAEVISTKPNIIRLNFVPNGLGNYDKPYGLTEMKNICVSCGSVEDLTRHHIVPKVYKKEFPLEYKNHSHHDILLLCISCHQNYERKADILKLELSNKYNAPINNQFINKIDPKIVKYSSAILKNSKNIPLERVEEMKKFIEDFFQLSLDEIDLKSILLKEKINMAKNHGKLVVSKINDIQEFIELWRSHFIENVECNYLPDNWKIENKIIINTN